MECRNQGMNKLTKDEYENVMVAFSNKVNVGTAEVNDITATNQHKRMLEEGKTIKLHKLLAFQRRARSTEQITDFMSMTFAFDPETRLCEFRDQIGVMYDRVIHEYIERECPEHIFNTGLYNNKRADFIEYVTSTSKRGRDLRKLVTLYLDEVEA
jgi:hypothetical protein